MKRLMVVAIACIVVDQLKTEHAWLTTCKGIEGNGQIILEDQVQPGREVNYRPFIIDGDEYIHGQIVSIGAPHPFKTAAADDGGGKLP